MTGLFARRGWELGLVLGLALAAGCGSSAQPPPGKACVLNTECNNPLACTFGKCHAQCIESRDCAPGQRCVKSTAGNVCQLEVEKNCPASGVCMQPLICATDLQCRNNCTTAAECPLNQMCASGTCAEASEVGPDGKLKVGDAGAGGGPDGGAKDGPPSGTTGPCGVPDNEPNDTKDQSVTIPVPTMFTSCLGTRDDNDYYEVTSPADPGGGYFQFSITGVTTAEMDLKVISVADNGEIQEIVTDSGGQDLHGFMAAAGSQKYRLVISPFAGLGMPPEKYTFKIAYTKVEDMYEPNNTKETAKPIALGATITAFMHDGYKGATIGDDDIADWYVVTAAAGNVIVKVESVATDLSADVTIVDSTGTMKNIVTGNNGQNVMGMLEGVAAGPVHILVKPFVVSRDMFIGRLKLATDPLPDHITKPYKLTVTQ